MLTSSTYLLRVEAPSPPQPNISALCLCRRQQRTQIDRYTYKRKTLDFRDSPWNIGSDAHVKISEGPWNNKWIDSNLKKKILASCRFYLLLCF